MKYSYCWLISVSTDFKKEVLSTTKNTEKLLEDFISWIWWTEDVGAPTGEAIKDISDNQQQQYLTLSALRQRVSSTLHLIVSHIEFNPLSKKKTDKSSCRKRWPFRESTRCDWFKSSTDYSNSSGRLRHQPRIIPLKFERPTWNINAADLYQF